MCEQKSRKHGASGQRKNGKRSKPWPEYSVWLMMKNRCLNKKSKDYSYYGGRGISISKSWVNDFSQFIKDMGRCPRGLTLERVNNNGNYEPENCCWVSRKAQSQNRRQWKLSKENKALAIAWYATGEFSQKVIANQFGVEQSRISQIIRGI